LLPLHRATTLCPLVCTASHSLGELPWANQQGRVMPWAPPDWCKVPRPETAPAVITLQRDDGTSRQHNLSGSAYYLLERCQPEQDQTSRWHAAVLRNEQGHCFIMDLSSSTGTFVNEQRLLPNKAYRWPPGTVVVLGLPPHHIKATLQLSRGMKRSRDNGLPEEASSDGAPGGRAAKRRQSAPEQPEPTPTLGGSGAAGACSGSTGPRCAESAATSSGKCDRCDGPHPTEACPHFRKPRDDHKDAWVNYGRKHPLQMGRSGGKFFLRSGRAVPQPGDGSCLFHSLCFGLNGGRPSGPFVACTLRKELAHFVQRNPRLKISGDTLEEWVRWDTNSSVDSYTKRMAVGGWGGGIEMAACSLLKRVNVHVYERRRGGTFERISCFDSPTPTKQTIHVLYQGGVHFDALVPHLAH